MNIIIAMARRFDKMRFLLVAVLFIAAGFSILGAVSWEEGADARKADYLFMEAMRQNALEDNAGYYDLIRAAYLLDTTNTAVGAEYGYYRLALAEEDSAMFDEGYLLMRRHFEAEPEDYYASTFYGMVNEKIGNDAEALRVWSVLDSLFPERPDAAAKYADLLSASADSSRIAKAVAIYNRIQKAEGPDIGITSRKIRAYSAVRDTLSMLAEIRDLIEASPMNAEFNVFAGQIFSRLSMPDSAIFYLDRACELDSTSGVAFYSRADFYKSQGDSVAFDHEVFRALKLGSLDLDSKLTLLTNYIKELYSDTTQQTRIGDLFTVLLEEHPHEVSIHDLYCSYLVAIGDFSSAADQLGYSLDIDPSEEGKWRNLMSLCMQDKDYPRAIETGERALRYFPESPMLNLMQASGYTMIKDYPSALSFLDAGLQYAEPEDYELRSQILCTIADNYYLSEQGDSAFAYYDRALELDPRNMLALNNCAYYLACAGRDLDRAERMSAITVEDDPENATSLDTYAWIFFKKRDYAKAKEYIDKALEFSEEPSAELLQHAGDICFMIGEPDKALEYWQDALSLDPSDELLQRKVKFKTYFYK